MAPKNNCNCNLASLRGVPSDCPQIQEEILAELDKQLQEHRSEPSCYVADTPQQEEEKDFKEESSKGRGSKKEGSEEKEEFPDPLKSQTRASVRTLYPPLPKYEENPWEAHFRSLCETRDTNWAEKPPVPWLPWPQSVLTEAKIQTPPPIQAFPTNLNPTPQTPLRWHPQTQETLRQLRKAPHEDGIQSPWFNQLLETISLEANIPFHCFQIARAFLPWGRFPSLESRLF